MRKPCSFLLLLALLPGATGALARATSAWELVHPVQFDWRVKAQRQSVAADLLSRVALLAAVVPPQEPDQAQKLEQASAALEALGDAATARQRSRLYLSRAYQHQRLLNLLAETEAALLCAEAEQNVEREMFCWSEASVHLMDEQTLDVALNVLRQARMIPRDEDMPVKAQDPKVWYDEYGRGIVRHIIMPYLHSRAPGEAATEQAPIDDST